MVDDEPEERDDAGSDDDDEEWDDDGLSNEESGDGFPDEDADSPAVLAYSGGAIRAFIRLGSYLNDAKAAVRSEERVGLTVPLTSTPFRAGGLMASTARLPASSAIMAPSGRRIKDSPVNGTSAGVARLQSGS